MEINEAIKQTREFAKIMREIGEKHARGNGRSLAAETAFQDAEALETVLDALEVERNRNRATKPVDLLADLTGDGREGTR